ncbi:hypothetical protein Q5752_001715 [Cryptotrichosporon argae]
MSSLRTVRHLGRLTQLPLRALVPTAAPLAALRFVARARAAPLSTSAPRLKKFKAAKVKAAAPAAGVDEADVDRIVDKTKARMGKTADWARLIVFDHVERGKGRVTPALLDPVKVTLPDQPGLVPLNAVASVTVKGGALIVEVWDKAAEKHVEAALYKANLPGLSIQRDAGAIRIPVTKPTAEIRAALLKHVHDTVETARIQIRQARTDGLKALGGRGEDGADDVQELANKYGGEVDALEVAAKKELAK